MRKAKDLAIFFSNVQAGIFEVGVPAEQAFFGYVSFEKGIIEEGYVKEPELLLSLLSKFFIQEKIKPRKITHILHDQNYLIRDIKINNEELLKTTIDAHIEGKIGKSIHLPYQNPAISSIIRDQNETDTRVICIVSDADLLHSYHDVYDRLKVKEISFEVSVLPQYNLYIKNHPEMQDETLMFVSIYEGSFAIQIIENKIPIFNLIEECDGGREEYILEVENYVERIANYYRYNMRKGKRQVQGVILFSFDPDYESKDVQKDFVKKLKAYKANVCEEMIFNPLINALPKVALPPMTYAKSFDQLAAFHSQFPLIRPRRSVLYGNYLNIVSFTLVAMMFLIYMPFYALQEDIKFQQNKNNALQTQLSTLRDETPVNPNYSELQTNYSNAYEMISAYEFSVSPYLTHLIDLLGSDVFLVNYQLRAQQKEIKLIITALEEQVLLEYVLMIYETHGIISSQESSIRWMMSKPVTKFNQPLVLEVVIYYA